MKAIDSLTKYDKWKRAVGIRSDKRMKGAELILRYFALRDNRAKYEKPLSSFLDQYSTANKNIMKTDVDEMSVGFKKVIDLIDAALGKFAFRMYDEKHKVLSPFNSALYDAEMIGFTETKCDRLLSGKYKPMELRDHIAPLFGDKNFENSIRQATSDEQSVKTRIDTMIKHLDRF